MVEPPPKPDPQSSAREAREAKLAKALRDNLRRRKASAPKDTLAGDS